MRAIDAEALKDAITDAFMYYNPSLGNILDIIDEMETVQDMPDDNQLKRRSSFWDEVERNQKFFEEEKNE